MCHGHDFAHWSSTLGASRNWPYIHLNVTGRGTRPVPLLYNSGKLGPLRGNLGWQLWPS